MEKNQQCTGTAKSTGQQCEKSAINGTDKCRLHGGATPVKHGLYSKYSDNRLADKIEKLKTDEEDLLDLRNTVALQQSLLIEIMDEVDSLDAETAETLNKIAESLSRTRKRLATIEDGIDVNVRDIRTLVEKVVVVVQEETDAQTAERIGQRILQEGESDSEKLGE